MGPLSVFVKKGEMYSLSLTHRYKTWYFQDLHILKIIFQEWFNSSKKNNKDIFVGRLKEKHVDDAQGKAMDFLLI